MALKVYQSIEEGLQDIERGKSDLPFYACFELDYKKKDDETIKLRFETLVEQMIVLLNYTIAKKEQTAHAKQHPLMCIWGELTVNAWKHSCDIGRGSILSEFYVGQRGILSGTRQSNNFLSAGDIELLRNSQNVPSSKPEGGGGGTQLLIDCGRGIYIDKQQREIYVAGYFRNQEQ